MTLREACFAAEGRLSEREEVREHAARDAEHLVLHVLGLTKTAVHAHPEMPLSPAQTMQVEALVTRRLACEPMQYIVGEQEFFGLAFAVTPATLIPRPETELLVEAVLALLAPGSAPRLIDVGTGSGAIAVALAHFRPDAHLVALDVSAEALAVAEANARRNGVAERIVFRESDLLAALPRGFEPDAIVSNPPYVPEGDRMTLHPQVREHEPSIALFAGVDGLGIYRRLLPQAYAALRAGGLLALEIGFGQAEALAELLGDWQEVEFLDDLQGIPRVMLARRPG